MLDGVATSQGLLKFPAFLPDATRGVVRGLDSADLSACGVRALMVNVFHLLVRPGTRTIAALGGMREFMGWRGPIAADSGGFQAYSLIQDNPKFGAVTAKGFACTPEKGGRKILLTPEKCVQAQFRLGADIIFCLDLCTHPQAPRETQQASADHTVRWAKACRREYDVLADRKGLSGEARPLLFGIVQGGEDAALRRACAEQLLEIGFDGYGYGGWPVVEGGRLSDSVALVAELLPADKPRFALGIGKPENVVRAFRVGYHLFDCTIPTRDARHLRLYVFRGASPSPSERAEDFYECLYMQDEKFRGDGRPIDEHCDCAACARYSRAYLHHLFRIGDSLAPRLATIHNLRFYCRLVDALGEQTLANHRP